MRKLSPSRPRERARHATLFDTSALLFDGEHLLCSLLNAENDPTQPETNRAVFRKRRARLTSLLNSLLESEGLSVAQVRPSEVLYADRQGAQVTLDSLSDGFRSFLSLILDMLAHLHLSGVGMAEGAADPLDALDTLEGVVLIDEADVHLHPSWQRRLGDKLRAVFPRVQFIVTTHSPFIAQSATPNGLFRLRSDGGKVTVEQVQMDPEGQTADQLLLSELFDLPSTRDTDTEAKMLRRQALLSQVSRSPDEERELLALGDELNLRLRRSGEDLRDRELMDRAWALLRGGGR
ncbi:MAG: AAA family ATPase [Deltaproteobacteria bacterium]|nr:AAA family ATPase [Deltaproteobacteria bacterium]